MAGNNLPASVRRKNNGLSKNERKTRRLTRLNKRKTAAPLFANNALNNSNSKLVDDLATRIVALSEERATPQNHRKAAKLVKSALEKVDESFLIEALETMEPEELVPYFGIGMTAATQAEEPKAADAGIMNTITNLFTNKKNNSANKKANEKPLEDSNRYAVNTSLFMNNKKNNAVKVANNAVNKANTAVNAIPKQYLPPNATGTGLLNVANNRLEAVNAANKAVNAAVNAVNAANTTNATINAINAANAAVNRANNAVNKANSAANATNANAMTNAAVNAVNAANVAVNRANATVNVANEEPLENTNLSAVNTSLFANNKRNNNMKALGNGKTGANAVLGANFEEQRERPNLRNNTSNFNTNLSRVNTSLFANNKRNNNMKALGNGKTGANAVLGANFEEQPESLTASTSANNVTANNVATNNVATNNVTANNVTTNNVTANNVGEEVTNIAVNIPSNNNSVAAEAPRPTGFVKGRVANIEKRLNKSRKNKVKSNRKSRKNRK